MPRRQNLHGQRFGSLVVVKLAPRGQCANAQWVCKCDCGQEVIRRGDRLRSGRSTMCCINGHHPQAIDPADSRAREALYPSEYSSWQHLRDRCNNPQHERYPHYGGRGIKVCAQWSDFSVFLADMGRKPGPKWSIERIDVNGNYEPGNCKWLPLSEQQENTTRTIMVDTVLGPMRLKAYADAVRMPYQVLYQRLKKGMNLDDATDTPIRSKRSAKTT